MEVDAHGRSGSAKRCRPGFPAHRRLRYWAALPLRRRLRRWQVGSLAAMDVVAIALAVLIFGLLGALIAGFDRI